MALGAISLGTQQKLPRDASREAALKSEHACKGHGNRPLRLEGFNRSGWIFSPWSNTQGGITVSCISPSNIQTTRWPISLRVLVTGFFL